MGHWGIKSYEVDEAADSLDEAFEQIHGAEYIDLMADDNPATVDQVHQKLVNPQTLAASIEALNVPLEQPSEDWDEVERLAFAGIVVRHAEFGVPIPELWREKAIEALENESIDWEEATKRRLRKEKELQLLRAAGPASRAGLADA